MMGRTIHGIGDLRCIKKDKERAGSPYFDVVLVREMVVVTPGCDEQFELVDHIVEKTGWQGMKIEIG